MSRRNGGWQPARTRLLLAGRRAMAAASAALAFSVWLLLAPAPTALNWFAWVPDALLRCIEDVHTRAQQGLLRGLLVGVEAVWVHAETDPVSSCYLSGDNYITRAYVTPDNIYGPTKTEPLLTTPANLAQDGVNYTAGVAPEDAPGLVGYRSVDVMDYTTKPAGLNANWGRWEGVNKLTQKNAVEVEGNGKVDWSDVWGMRVEVLEYVAEGTPTTTGLALLCTSSNGHVIHKDGICRAQHSRGHKRVTGISDGAGHERCNRGKSVPVR